MADRPPVDSPAVKISRSFIMLGLICTIAFVTTFSQQRDHPVSDATTNAEESIKKPGTKTPKLPKPTPAPVSIPVTGNCRDLQAGEAEVAESAFFGGQESPADGETFQANTTFKKSWTITNNGPVAWEAGAVLHFIDGYRMGDAFDVEIPATSPGQTIEIILTLKAPSQEGHYRADWRLCNARKLLFGPPLWVDINVTSG